MSESIEPRKDHHRCGNCQEDFCSLNLFDEHRSEWRVRPDGELIGRCLTPEEMDLREVNGCWYDRSGLAQLAKLAAARSTKASFKLSEE